LGIAFIYMKCQIWVIIKLIRLTNN
jgi:hypothetical protein